MPQLEQVIELEDFTGGLNLTSQLQNLASNETPDSVNMDFGLRGGFVTRGGFRHQGYDTDWVSAQILGATYFSKDVVLVLHRDGSLYDWDGSTLTDSGVNITDDVDERVEMAVFNRKAYFAGGYNTGNLEMSSWDGTVKTVLANTFNDTYTTPDGGDMPLARHIASHNGFMWVADTTEGGTRYPHRVRFSHIQNPEDWATADYFDVEPTDDGDPITALVPFQDVLLIFKRSSVFVVYGYDRTDFILDRISTVSGTICSDGAAVHSGVCYWITPDGTVMAYNGRGTVPLGDKIRWWADTGKIKQAGNHCLMWSVGRLWLSLEAGDAETPDRWLFVYDPEVKAFSRYDWQPTPRGMFHWNRLGQADDPLFLDETYAAAVFRYDRENEVDVIYGPLGSPAVVNADIDAYYRTSWITGGETASKKRWRRARLTASSLSDLAIRVNVYHDFDPNTLVKFWDVDITGDSDSTWGSMIWGTGTWQSGAEGNYTFVKMPSGGSSRAIQYEFRVTGVTPISRWWIDSIALPYRKKEIR